MVSSLLAAVGLAGATLAPGHAQAASLKTLVNFCSQTNCTDGSRPFAGLIADAKGNLFGTTEGGGANPGPFGGGGGTVFEIIKTATGYASTPTVLVSFCAQTNCTDGKYPDAGLLIDAAGNLFGTTAEGGAHGGGTVFEVVKTATGYASTPNVLVSFCAQANCADGADPVAGLIADAAGNLFGTTGEGGAGPFHLGTVFEVAKTATGYASTPTTLVSFCTQTHCADGAEPMAGLIADAKGNLFGTTFGVISSVFEAANPGTVFEVAKTVSGYASRPTTLVTFCAPDCTDGWGPLAGLIADAAGNLFGTTGHGGAGGDIFTGTVFEIAKTASGYATTPTVLASFCTETNCADGAFPTAGLIADAAGNLFGTTAFGGASRDFGTVFKVAKTASGYASTPTVLVSFCAQTNCTDGAEPVAGLIADGKGNLFGTTSQGGAHNGGTVFEITDSGFVPPAMFAGTPGKPNCYGQSVSALTKKYGGLKAAAAALGYSSVQLLQNAITTYCAA